MKDDGGLFDVHVHVLIRELWYCLCLNKSRFKSSLFNPLPQLSSHRASAGPEFKRKLTCSINPTASNTRGKPQRKAENPTALAVIMASGFKYFCSSFLIADVGERVVDLSCVTSVYISQPFILFFLFVFMWTPVNIRSTSCVSSWVLEQKESTQRVWVCVCVCVCVCFWTVLVAWHHCWWYPWHRFHANCLVYNTP